MAISLIKLVSIASNDDLATYAFQYQSRIYELALNLKKYADQEKHGVLQGICSNGMDENLQVDEVKANATYLVFKKRFKLTCWAANYVFVANIRV